MARQHGIGPFVLDLLVGGNAFIITRANLTDTIAKFTPYGSVDLYFDGTKRFETTNTGAVVTGILTATTGTFTTGITTSLRSNKISVGDNERINVGLGSDIQLYHDESNSYIDSSTGLLFLRNTGSNGSQIQLLNNNSGVKIQALAGEQSIVALANSKVELYFNGSKKFETAETGAVVTGILTATSSVNVGSGITLSSDGDIFAVGVSTLGNGSSGQAILQYQGSTKLTTQNWGVQATGTFQAIGNLEAVNTSSQTDGKNIHIKNLKSGGGVKNVLTLSHESNNSSITGHVGNISINAPIVSISTNFTVAGDSTLTGSVGINVTDPDAKLEVRDSSATGIIVRSTATQATDSNKALRVRNNSDTNTFSVSHKGQGYFAGKVGIGQDTPAGQLHISSGTSGDCEVIIEADTDNDEEEDNPRILFRQDGGVDESMVGMDNNQLILANSVVSSGGIVFKTGTTNGYNNASERMKIHPDGEVRISSATDGSSTTFITLDPYSTSDNGNLNIFKYVDNSVIQSQITKQGQIFSRFSHYAGRVRTDASSPTNVFTNGGNGYFAYSGTTNDTTAYRNITFIRAWDGGDTGDRNVIYYTDSGSDTATSDYDQDQKFGIKANGMAQFGSHIFAGRVESDESSPNSVYLGSSGTAMIVYPTSASQYTRMDARTTDNTDQVFKVDSGGGVVIKFESQGNGRFDGGADIGNASDYAEYFEWLDGNTSSADRRGMTVILDGEKIRPATDSDDTSKIIGVVSANPAVVGDSAWSEWQLAHQKDVYGSWVTEDKEYLVWNKFGTFTDTDGVKKTNPQPDINDYNMASEYQILVSDIEKEKAAGNCPQAAIDQNLRVTRPSRTYNPDYDSTRTYEPRSQRKEWDAIGLMGKLVVRRGQPIGANWILMKSNVGTDPNDNSIILDKYLVR